MIERSIDNNTRGGRLDKYLRRLLPGANSGFIYKMLRKKNITLNGSKASGSEILEEGDVVRLFFSDETFGKFSVSKGAAENMTAAGSDHIDVIYEDNDVIILNKPAGILCQKAKPEDISLNEELLSYLAGKGEITDESLSTYTPSLVNRLDMNTSGLVLGAKTLSASRELSELIKNRLIGKFYLCVVEGKFEEDSGVLKGYLVKDEDTNMVSVSPNRTCGASYIETKYRVLGSAFGGSGTFGSSPASVGAGESEAARGSVDITLAEAELVTGKTHQIRAGFAAAGHPLLGDYKYGNGEYGGLRRQALHSYKVAFPKIMGSLSRLSFKEFTAPLPKDMEKLISGAGIM